MTTTKTRINISLNDDLHEALSRLARRDRIPKATQATRLLEKGIELEEDQIWDALANKRDTKKARFLSHKKAWL